MVLLDHAARLETRGDNWKGSAFTDALLDLRQSFSRFRTDPEEALRSWFSAGRILSRRDYLTAFRMRRLLENQVKVVVGEGDSEIIYDLDLRWKSIERLVNHHRRESYEMSEEEIDIVEIPVRFRCIFPY